MTNKGLVIDLGLDDEIKELGRAMLPDYYRLSFYKRLQNREIFWNQDVDEELVDFSYQILQWNKEDKQNNIPIGQRMPIKVFVNSDGGCLNSVMNFINVIQLSKTPVTTIAMGKVFSAGFLLLLAGHKKYCFKYSEGLLHSGSFGVMNSTEKVMDYIDHTKKTEKLVKEYVISNTKITSKEYDKQYRKEWYMTSEDMLNFGVVNKIIDDLDVI